MIASTPAIAPATAASDRILGSPGHVRVAGRGDGGREWDPIPVEDALASSTVAPAMPAPSMSSSNTLATRLAASRSMSWIVDMSADSDPRRRVPCSSILPGRPNTHQPRISTAMISRTAASTSPGATPSSRTTSSIASRTRRPTRRTAFAHC